MEHHVHKFLNRLRPAFGLWRGGYRDTLSAKPQKDIEFGSPSPIQCQSQDEAADAAEKAPKSQITGSLGPSHEDLLNLSAITTAPEVFPQPQFTEGPSRFVLAKDGPRDCVALLVNEGFLAKLRDLFQEERDLSVLEGPLCHAKMDFRNIEHLVQEGQNALETADSEEEAEKYQRIMEQQTSELHKIRRWKHELEEERDIIKSNLELSRNHTKWVLETAMREADLLGPEKPLPAISLREEELQDVEQEVAVPESSIPAQSPTASTANDHGEVEVSQEEIECREVYDEFIERSRFLETVQGKFDSQGFLYRENLAEFEEMAAAGTTNMSRSDFDRRKVRYGQQLTRALIDAEEEFEEARERAQTLGAISSDYGQEFYYGAEYEESWPENKIADYNASQDWSFIESWMDDIPDSNDPTSSHAAADLDSAAVEVDEWDAEEVDVNDSISMIDCEDYRREIDRYRRMCARLEDPCPEVRWLGQPDAAGALGRRSSCWM